MSEWYRLVLYVLPLATVLAFTFGVAVARFFEVLP